MSSSNLFTELGTIKLLALPQSENEENDQKKTFGIYLRPQVSQDSENKDMKNNSQKCVHSELENFEED